MEKGRKGSEAERKGKEKENENKQMWGRKEGKKKGKTSSGFTYPASLRPSCVGYLLVS